MEYIGIRKETLELVKRYPKDQRYELLEAMTVYAIDNVEPDWPEDDLKWYGWEGLKQQVDRARGKSDQNKANGSKAKRTEANASEPKRTEANLPKEKEKEEEKEKDIDDDATAHARETAFGTVNADPVIVAVQSELTGLTVSHYDDLAAFRQDLPDELVIEAINEAVAHGARTWAYVRSILQGYIKDGVKTVGQARERSERRRRQVAPGKKVTAQQYEQREYSEGELEGMVDGL